MGWGIKINNPIKSVVNSVTSGNVLKDAVKTATGTAMLGISGPTSLVANQTPVRDALKSDQAKQLTFGYSGDYAGFSRTATNLTTGKSVSNEDRNDAMQFGVKTGAAVAAGTVAAGTVYGFGSSASAPSLATAGKYYLGAQVTNRALARGDIAGALTSIGGTTYLNEILPVNGGGDFLTSLLPRGKTPSSGDFFPAPEPTYDGFPSLTASSAGGISMGVALLVLGAVAFLAMKGKI